MWGSKGNFDITKRKEWVNFIWALCAMLLLIKLICIGEKGRNMNGKPHKYFFLDQNVYFKIQSQCCTNLLFMRNFSMVNRMKNFVTSGKTTISMSKYIDGEKRKDSPNSFFSTIDTEVYCNRKAKLFVCGFLLKVVRN